MILRIFGNFGGEVIGMGDKERIRMKDIGGDVGVSVGRVRGGLKESCGMSSGEKEGIEK